MTIIKTYSELSQIQTYEERYRYLKLDGVVGEDTFGFDRYINQRFYKLREWKAVRDLVIVRDNGCDLGIEGREIFGKILIHHMNPILQESIISKSRSLLDPEFLICVTHATHNAIHYGDESLLIKEPIKRIKNDTCPWRR